MCCLARVQKVVMTDHKYTHPKHFSKHSTHTSVCPTLGRTWLSVVRVEMLGFLTCFAHDRSFQEAVDGVDLNGEKHTQHGNESSLQYSLLQIWRSLCPGAKGKDQRLIQRGKKRWTRLSEEECGNVREERTGRKDGLREQHG